MMINTSRFSHRHQADYRLACALVLGLAAIVTSAGGGTVAAQAADPCALITTDEVQALTTADVGSGVPSSSQAAGSSTCRYAWGGGVGRFKLDLTVNEASRMFPGMTPDAIKQQLQKLAKPGTVDAVIMDVGDAAVFKADSPVFAGTTAYLKGRILQVYLDGYDAQDKKDQLIALLKSAASRL